jgi:hypothetical protein
MVLIDAGENGKFNLDPEDPMRYCSRSVTLSTNKSSIGAIIAQSLGNFPMEAIYVWALRPRWGFALNEAKQIETIR